MDGTVAYLAPSKKAEIMGIGNDWRWSMKRRNLSPGTIEKRLSAMRRLVEYAGVPALELNTEQIQCWLDSCKIGARTRYTYISHVSSFFRWAIREGLTEADPTTRIDRPKVRNGLPRPIESRDLRRALAQATDPHLSAMLHLAAFGGLRCAEIAALCAEDINGDMMLVNGKGGRQRVVPLHPQVVAALRATHPPVYGPVFDMPAWKVSHTIRDHLQACDIRASAHQLRHWFATSVYEASGNDLRMTQELLGHSSPTTTAIYTGWARGRSLTVVGQLTA